MCRITSSIINKVQKKKKTEYTSSVLLVCIVIEIFPLTTNVYVDFPNY